MEARARANDPALLILTSLSSGPKHGYALLQDIADFARVQLGPGTLYGAIGRLETRGLIEALEPSGRTRPYTLTESGGEALATMLEELRAIVDVGTSRLKRPARPARAAHAGASS
jgi:DNA-binding PadR family transcriptional regulator